MGEADSQSGQPSKPRVWAKHPWGSLRTSPAFRVGHPSLHPHQQHAHMPTVTASHLNSSNRLVVQTHIDPANLPGAKALQP
eukprot:357937-Chlamydomonas_euryale.AAC.4